MHKFIFKFRSEMALLLLPKLNFLSRRFLREEDFTLLDVGCGNHSASVTKSIFPKCRYYGLDIYDNDAAELALMEKFYRADLRNGDLQFVKDNFFDAVIMSHVIEHIPNGLEIVNGLGRKLKEGGIIYIEYPGVNSLFLPTMKGALNFCDDPSHVRLYDIKEVANVLLGSGFKIIKAGKRRNLASILLSPFLLAYLCLTNRGPAGAFWDLLGFAEFVFAEKRR